MVAKSSVKAKTPFLQLHVHLFLVGMHGSLKLHWFLYHCFTEHSQASVCINYALNSNYNVNIQSMCTQRA